MKTGAIETFAYADPYQGGVPVAVSVVLRAGADSRGAIATGGYSSAFTACIRDGGLSFDGPLLDLAVEPDALSLRTVLHCALERDDILVAVVRAALEQPGDGTHGPLAAIVDSSMPLHESAAAIRRQFLAAPESVLVHA